MQNLTLAPGFNRPLALVMLATVVLLIALTSMMNPAPLRSAFAADRSVEVVVHSR